MLTRNRRSAGFSLLEILFAIALSTILIAITWNTFRGTTQKTNVREMAQVLASELQSARMRAISERTYAGLGFPTDGGTSVVSRSYYTFSSLGAVKYSRARNIENDFPDTDLFIGSWPTTSSSFSLDRPPTGLDLPGLDLPGLFKPDPMPKDFILLFTPTGTAVSNGLPLYGGRYRIVVGQNIQTGGPGAAPPGTGFNSPAPPYATLQSVASPHSIVISPLGSIEVHQGIENATSAVQITQVSPSNGGHSSPKQLSLGGANHAPTVEKVSLSPTANANMPSGVEGLISQEDFLRLSVEATDVDGDRLTCQWTTDGGAFASPNQQQKMTWDETSQRWVSTWTFRADPKDLPGKIYNLSCQVRDERQALGTAAAGVQLIQNIELRIKPRFCFTEFPMRGLYTCGMDGSDLQQVPLPGIQPIMPSFHPDGNTLMFYHFDWLKVIQQVYSVNRDGTNLRLLADNPAWGACYSPDGKTIAVATGPGDLTIMPSCGNVTPVPGAPAAFKIPHPGWNIGWCSVSFSQDSKKVCFQGRVAGVGPPFQEALLVADVATRTVTQITPIIDGSIFPGTDNHIEGYYSRDPAYPNKLIGTKSVSFGVKDLFLVDDTAGSVQQTLAKMGGYAESPNWSKDGKSIVYGNGQAIIFADVDIPGAKLNNERILLNWDRAPNSFFFW